MGVRDELRLYWDGENQSYLEKDVFHIKHILLDKGRACVPYFYGNRHILKYSCI